MANRLASLVLRVALAKTAQQQDLKHKVQKFKTNLNFALQSADFAREYSRVRALVC